MTGYIDNTIGYKLRLFSKRLSSGNYQITFHARSEDQDKKYGHVLVPERSTLKDVVYMIRKKLSEMGNEDLYHHRHLYSLGKPSPRNNNFIIFDK